MPDLMTAGFLGLISKRVVRIIMLQIGLVFQDSIFIVVAMVTTVHQLVFFAYLNMLSCECFLPLRDGCWVSVRPVFAKPGKMTILASASDWVVDCNCSCFCRHFLSILRALNERSCLSWCFNQQKYLHLLIRPRSSVSGPYCQVHQIPLISLPDITLLLPLGCFRLLGSCKRSFNYENFQLAEIAMLMASSAGMGFLEGLG